MSSDGVENMQNTEFDVVEYPPKLPGSLKSPQAELVSTRAPPLTEVELATFLDEDGRLVDEHGLRRAVFRGGVKPQVRTRRQVWQFLFGLYPFLSTARERQVLLADYHVRYNALKNRWKELLSQEEDGQALVNPPYLKNDGEKSPTDVTPHMPSQASSTFLPDLPSPEVKQQIAFMDIQAKVYAGRQQVNVSVLRSAMRIIDKDVPRTDRDCDYFRGVNNPNLRILRDILVTFAAFHTEVNYAQGMNDILSRFLMVFDSEVEAYWCFTKYIEKIQDDFLEDGIMNKLWLVRELLMELDVDLFHYLEFLGVGDLAFCHRWMLLSFKREFGLDDAQRCFEILSSHHLEVSSMEAEKARDEERRKDFEVQGGKARVIEAPVNTDYTFDIFMCVTILIEHRKEIFHCGDTASVFQFISSLTMKLNLDEVLSKAEVLFFKYCRKSVVDCFQVVDAPSPTSESYKHLTKQRVRNS